MTMIKRTGGGVMNIGRESEFVEFKKSTSETKEGIVSIASILNKHGHGQLYFGVKDDGEVVGLDIGKDTERKLSQNISDNIRPSVGYEINLKRSNDGKTFIEVQFGGSNAPYSAYGRYYQRHADEDRQIIDTELERLFQTRQKDYSAWENADSEETLADVDSERLKDVIRRGNESGRIRFEYSSEEAALTKMGLFNPKVGKLNNAGKVLLSKNRPVMLKTAVFATRTKETFVKLNHFEGNVFECIDEGISFVMSSINWNVAISGGARRDEKPEIPSMAIREMLVNAFAHGSYGANAAFSVEVFSDRVVIFSPGLFPIGFKPEDFATNAAEPIMLNPKIVNTLFKSAVIESFGSGYERTFAALKEAGLEYDYGNTMNGFRFVINRDLGQNNVHEMTKNEKKVYALLKNDKHLTIALLAKEIGKSEKTVSRALKALKENGYIERIGNDRDGYWEVMGTLPKAMEELETNIIKS